MKVCFISNYLNHHQLPFALAMQHLAKGGYAYISTKPISQARLDLGYQDLDHSYPFVIPAYDGPEQKAKAMQLAYESDIVILGSAPDEYLIRRLKAGKVTFKYSERVKKQKTTPYLFFRRIAAAWIRHGRFQKYPLYMLCSSAYTAGDYASYGDYLGKTYKWGYFPQVEEENLDAIFARRQAASKPSLLWAGRLIDWKHPEAAVNTAQALKARGYAFQLDIIGTGALEESLRGMIQEKNLGDHVRLLGAMPPEQVREHMRSADIYLFTSDYNEGWGAVLNESMNSGCAVVASHAIGAAPFLLTSGENGLIYEDGNQEQLDRDVMWLMDHPQERRNMGRRAYETMQAQWNADTAAQRLVALYEHLCRGNTTPLFSSGPCSPASPIQNRDGGKLAVPPKED